MAYEYLPTGDGTALAYSLESGDLLCQMEGHSAAVRGAIITRKGRCASLMKVRRQ